MAWIADEIKSAARACGALVFQSANWTSESLQQKLSARFSTQTSGAALWERLDYVESLHDPRGWSMVADFVGERPCLLGFEPDLERSAFEFRRGADLTAVLGECSGFVFYVCDEELSYLLCFNDHDYLIAVGAARSWLTAISDPPISDPP